MEHLISLYEETFGYRPIQTEMLAKAGSNRCYVRLTAPDQSSCIGVVSNDTEESRCFVYLAQHFAACGNAVPQIIAVAADYGCYLQEDLGRLSLYDALAAGRKAGGLYSDDEVKLLEESIRLLPHLQVEGAKDLDWNQILPPRSLNQRAAMFDLNYFKYMFLKTSDLPFDEERLEDDMQALASDLVAKSNGHKTFLYRDFQARNIMLRSLPDGSLQPVMIDFQGGQQGPIYYDVASFLSQASARYGQALRRHLAGVYLQELSHIVPWAPSREEFDNDLLLFILFRTMQVLGAYGLRGRFERKQYFLDSIPPALDNLRQLLTDGVCEPYPYLQEVLRKVTQI